MKAIISFEIECGEKTCASAPGTFCKYFLNDMRGDGRCYFFGKVFDVDGWIQRHPDCFMHASKKYS